MKIKIEADLNLNEKETLMAIAAALRKWEVAKLMEAYRPGDHFNMENETGKIVITKL